MAELRAVVRLVLGTLSAGVAAGAVAGVGARVVMFVIGLMNHSHDGEVTHANFATGHLTAAGTLNLVITGALVFGVPGAIFYLLVRPWLPTRVPARGAVFSVLLLALGFSTFSQDNGYEYVRYVSPAVAVPMFMAVFPLYGSVLAALAERITGASREPVPNRIVRVGGWALLTAVITLGSVALVRHLQRDFGLLGG